MAVDDLKVGFFGDSIFYGYQTDYEYRCWRVFERESGIKVISNNRENPLGFPGGGVFDLLRFLPSLFETFDPDVLFLCIGANHFDSAGVLKWPYGINERGFLKAYQELFSKLLNSGMEVIFTGIPPLEQGGKSQETALDWSMKIAEVADKFEIKSAFFTQAFIDDENWDAMGGPYYNNLAIDLHPNNEGQSFIGRFCLDYFKNEFLES